MSSDLRASAGAEDAHELSSGVAHERLPSSDFELMAAVTSSRRTTLARTDSYQITLHEADTASRKVLVTFGSIKSKLSEAGFGTSFALASGYDNIYVAQKGGTQYQGLSLSDFKSAVMEACQGKEVYCYGSSLGGYCALYYGGVVNARIISFSPRNSAHPEFLAKKFKNVVFTHVDLTQTVKSSYDPIVFFDPLVKIDKRFVDRKLKKAYPNAVIYEIPHGSHVLLQALSEATDLKRFARNIIESHAVNMEEVDWKNSSVWNAGRAKYELSNGRPRSALSFARRSLDISPNHTAYYVKVQSHILQGHYKRALVTISRAEKHNIKVNIKNMKWVQEKTTVWSNCLSLIRRIRRSGRKAPSVIQVKGRSA